MTTPKTDRELLEMAAKAADYQYAKHGGYIVVDGIPGNWNPLTNDGDALRLAVSCLPFHILKYSAEDYEYCKQDGFAATRRAIVRAAAEIGKVMK